MTDARQQALRVLVLTTHPVTDGVGGELLMHRHMRSAPQTWKFEFHHLGDEHIRLNPLLKHFHHGPRRLQRLIKAWDAWSGISVQSQPLRRLCSKFKPHLLYTIADGPVAFRVWQLAKRMNLPWITQLNDWYPTGLDVSHRFEPALSGRYRRLLQEASRTLCFSEEIREAAGNPSCARVLYPIAESYSLPEIPQPKPHALFAGRFDHFLGPEMKSLIGLLRQSNTPDRLQIIGPDEHWDKETRLLLKDTGIYRGLLKGAPFHEALVSAGILLVLAPFGPERRHLARYSFPSKIPEYCLHGRPILVWGPEECSSVCWARRTGAAVVVSTPDPQQVIAAMDRLREDSALANACVSAAKLEADTTFHPERLQNIFEQAILDATSPLGQ